MRTNNNAAVRPERAAPPCLRKRIGSTTFEVTIHFSKTSKGTLEDKLLRLILTEAGQIPIGEVQREVSKVA